jgi:hypothetical protein
VCRVTLVWDRQSLPSACRTGSSPASTALPLRPGGGSYSSRPAISSFSLLAYLPDNAKWDRLSASTVPDAFPQGTEYSDQVILSSGRDPYLDRFPLQHVVFRQLLLDCLETVLRDRDVLPGCSEFDAALGISDRAPVFSGHGRGQARTRVRLQEQALHGEVVVLLPG